MSEGADNALLLIDLQQDFLRRPGMTPSRENVIAGAGELLSVFRRSGLPVLHVQTRIRADGSDAMPHWQRPGGQACVDGSAGAEPPPPAAPVDGEPVFIKCFFNAFGAPGLMDALNESGVKTLVLAGLFQHACIHTTAVEAYERGFEVWIATDATGTTEPMHAELSRAWLRERCAEFLGTRQIAHRCGHVQDQGTAAADAGDGTPPAAVAALRRTAGQPLSASLATRRQRLVALAEAIESRRDELVTAMAEEIAKPVTQGEEEIGRACAHVAFAADLPLDDETVAPGVTVRYRPLGCCAIITPWNNPVAIAIGKIAPALVAGNTVAWKPSPLVPRTSAILMQALEEAGCGGAVQPVSGGAETARALVANPEVAAVSFTGSMANGRALAALCTAHGKPFQAELGGKNACVVLDDAVSDHAARGLALAAFGFAGQRCTALRRFIVAREALGTFEAAFVRAINTLRMGDPKDPATELGPLAEAAGVERTEAAIAGAVAAGGACGLRWASCGRIRQLLPSDLDHGCCP